MGVRVSPKRLQVAKLCKLLLFTAVTLENTLKHFNYKTSYHHLKLVIYHHLPHVLRSAAFENGWRRFNLQKPRSSLEGGTSQSDWLADSQWQRVQPRRQRYLTEPIGLPIWERLLYSTGCPGVKTKQKNVGTLLFCRQQRNKTNTPNNSG